MTRENDFAARMIADTALMAILTGGVYQSGLVGMEGIGRESAAAAFDATTKYLKPCALVKQRGNIFTGEVEDYTDLSAAARQVVEVWLYEDRGYTAIDAAMARIYALFQGYQFGGTFEIRLALVIDRQRDMGSLANASLVRLDWQVDSIYQGV